MITVILRRILAALPSLLILTLVTFLMIKAVPGDPARLVLGERASPDALEHLRHEMGLDRPWFVQYGRYLDRVVLHGDFGRTLRSNQEIGPILIEKFPATIELAIGAIFIACFVGIPMGLIAARFPGTIVDFFSMTIAVLGVSMPIFWLALMLLWIFGLQLEWLPLSGRFGIEYYYEPITGLALVDSIIRLDWPFWRESFRHLILPSIALGTIPMAIIARITRSSMLEVIGHDYIRTARAKGLSNMAVYFRHALQNATIPIITILGLQFGALLGGAVITETIFSWPGIGSWLLESVSARDFPALQGGVLVVATAFVLVNLVVDLLYRYFDPRIRAS